MGLLYVCGLPAFWLIHEEGEAGSSAVSEVLLDGHACPRLRGKQLAQAPRMWMLDAEHRRLVLLGLVHSGQEAAEQAGVLTPLPQQPAFCWHQHRKVGVETFSKPTAGSLEGCTDLLRRDFFKGNFKVVTSRVDSEAAADNVTEADKARALGSCASRGSCCCQVKTDLTAPQLALCPWQRSTEKPAPTLVCLKISVSGFVRDEGDVKRKVWGDFMFCFIPF